MCVGITDTCMSHLVCSVGDPCALIQCKILAAHQAGVVMRSINIDGSVMHCCGECYRFACTCFLVVVSTAQITGCSVSE